MSLVARHLLWHRAEPPITHRESDPRNRREVCAKSPRKDPEVADLAGAAGYTHGDGGEQHGVRADNMADRADEFSSPKASHNDTLRRQLIFGGNSAINEFRRISPSSFESAVSPRVRAASAECRAAHAAADTLRDEAASAVPRRAFDDTLCEKGEKFRRSCDVKLTRWWKICSAAPACVRPRVRRRRAQPRGLATR